MEWITLYSRKGNGERIESRMTTRFWLVTEMPSLRWVGNPERRAGIQRAVRVLDTLTMKGQGIK